MEEAALGSFNTIEMTPEVVLDMLKIIEKLPVYKSITLMDTEGEIGRLLKSVGELGYRVTNTSNVIEGSTTMICGREDHMFQITYSPGDITISLH